MKASRTFAIFLLCVLGAWLIPFDPARAQEPPRATALAWSPDGTRLAVGGVDGVRILDGAMVQVAHLLDLRADVSALAWSGDGARLAAGRYDGLVRLWDVRTGERLRTLRGHIGVVNAVAWSADETRLATAGDDTSVRLWDAATGDLQRLFERHRDRAYGVAWEPSGARLVSVGAENAVLLWEAESASVLPAAQLHVRAVEAVAWEPNGERYATVSRDRTVRVWRATPASAEAVAGFTGHEDRVVAVAWRPDGMLLTASWDRTIRLWDIGKRQSAVLLNDLPERVRVIAFVPDGRWVAFVATDGSVQVRALT